MCLRSVGGVVHACVQSSFIPDQTLKPAQNQESCVSTRVQLSEDTSCVFAVSLVASAVLGGSETCVCALQTMVRGEGDKLGGVGGHTGKKLEYIP